MEKLNFNTDIDFEKCMMKIMENTRSEIPFSLKVKEVMKLLNLSKNKVFELIHSGELPAKKIGSTWRIPRDQLLAWFYGQQLRGIESEVKV